MTGKDKAFQIGLAATVVVAIVGGNFLIQRLRSGFVNQAAEASSSQPVRNHRSDEPVLPDDLTEFRAQSSEANMARAANRRERVANIISRRLPDATTEERDSWFEQLHDVSPEAAEAIFDFREQVGPLDPP